MFESVVKKMQADSQTRKWQITINNPIEKGYSHEKIIEICKSYKSMIYFCFSDEVGEKGTFHTHIYIQFSSAVRFSSILKKFDGGHFEMCKGTAQQNRDYVFKEGKHKGTNKEETNIKDSHYEFNELPVERQGKRNDLDDLYDMIKAGMSNYDIITENPSYIKEYDKLDKIRDMFRSEHFNNIERDIIVEYINGPAGCGKTRSIYDKYNYNEVYYVSDYLHPFDNYDGQDVIVFDEFRSSIRIGDFLKFIDRYPIKLPCRYSNRTACYTKVYIISNISIDEQYPMVKLEEKLTWSAFFRRINFITEYIENIPYTYTREQYITGFRHTLITPFDINKIS